METELEWILTHSKKAEMISWLNSHPESFEEAIHLAVTDKQPYSWRAAFVLWSCMKDNDPRIFKYLKPLLDALTQCKDNQLRELLIILSRMDVPEEFEGDLFGKCADIWKKTGRQASVRYSAYKLMVRIAHKYPELFREVEFLTQSQYLDTLSETTRKSVLKLVGVKEL